MVPEDVLSFVETQLTPVLCDAGAHLVSRSDSLLSYQRNPVRVFVFPERTELFVEFSPIHDPNYTFDLELLLRVLGRRAQEPGADQAVTARVRQFVRLLPEMILVLAHMASIERWPDTRSALEAHAAARAAEL